MYSLTERLKPVTHALYKKLARVSVNLVQVFESFMQVSGTSF